MGTTTVRDVLWRVSVLLQDVSPQFNRWPEVELVNWLNDAQLAITKFLPASCSRIDSIKLKNGSRQSIEAIDPAECIPSSGIAPSSAVFGVQLIDFIRNMGADGVTAGKPIPPPVDRRILDTQRPNWHIGSGAVVSQVTYDPRTPKHFYVQPAVLGDVWLEIAYIAQPDKIPAGGIDGSENYKYGTTTSNATISISDEFIDELTNYVVARAYMKDADFAGNDSKAAMFATMFTSSLNAKVAALTGNNPNLQRLPFAPEPMGAAS